MRTIDHRPRAGSTPADWTVAALPPLERRIIRVLPRGGGPARRSGSRARSSRATYPGTRARREAAARHRLGRPPRLAVLRGPRSCRALPLCGFYAAGVGRVLGHFGCRRRSRSTSAGPPAPARMRPGRRLQRSGSGTPAAVERMPNDPPGNQAGRRGLPRRRGTYTDADMVASPPCFDRLSPASCAGVAGAASAPDASPAPAAARTGARAAVREHRQRRAPALAGRGVGRAGGRRPEGARRLGNQP